MKVTISKIERVRIEYDRETEHKEVFDSLGMEWTIIRSGAKLESRTRASLTQNLIIAERVIDETVGAEL